MEKSSQIAWKLVPLRHFFPLKVVSLIEELLYQDPFGIASHIGQYGIQSFILGRQGPRGWGRRGEGWVWSI
jgi:hypothetical protein